MRTDTEDITAWLNELGTDTDTGKNQSDSDSDNVHASSVGNELFAWLYDDLHRVARNHIYKEHVGHTLSASALTHEAWFRMSAQTRTRWANRSHFLAVASTVMRRILVKHAVAKRTEKRDAALVSLTAAEQVAAVTPDADVVAVHEALLAFETVDPRAAQVVELKYFGGMEYAEIAEALGISLATVKRDWSLARAWLLRELSNS
jgi:RNA polymerase sigma factor (TIGR02999 family)